MAGSNDADVHLETEEAERENLIARVKHAVEVLDVEVLKFIEEIIPNLRSNPGIKEAVKSLFEKGSAFIQNYGIKLPEISASSPKSKLNMGSRLDHETHPLNNEIILKKIFAYASVSDLKNIRLVCKNWRNYSIRLWRGKAVFPLEILFCDNQGSFGVPALEFPELSFHRYRLFYSSFEPCFGAKRNILNFFRATMHYLKIECDDIRMMHFVLTSLPDLREAALDIRFDDTLQQYNSLISSGRVCPLQDLRPTSSNLRKLEISFLTLMSGHDPRIKIYPWKKLFEYVPSVKSLRVIYDQEIGEEQLVILLEILRALSEVRKEGNFTSLQLEELDLMDPKHAFKKLPADVLTYISECKLSLKTICLDLGTNSNLSLALDLLEELTGSLEFMKCNLGPNIRDFGENLTHVLPSSVPLPPAVYFPWIVQLPNLKEFVFGSGCVCAFSFLRALNAPSLEKLRIETRKLRKTEYAVQLDLRTLVPQGISQTFMEGTYFPNLKEFYYDGERNFSKEELKGLGKAMPNLKDLTIPFCDKTFPIIYELWPGLESLQIHGDVTTYLLFDDFCITGVRDGHFSAQSRNAKLTALAKLRKFVFEARSENKQKFHGPRTPLITDISAVFGFLQLPKLQYLRLETVCSFSPSIQTALEDHISEIKISRPAFLHGEGDQSNDSESDCVF